MRRFSRLLFVLALCAALLPTPARAQYTVTQDLSALTGGGTFYLEFQLSDGSQVANQTARATVSNFSLSGGALSGAGSALGDASGSLDTALVLRDMDPAFNGLADYVQGFTISNPTGLLTFRLDLELTGGADTPTPDAFFFFILDAAQVPLPTSGVTGTEFLIFDFTETPTTPTAYASDASADPPLPAPVVTLTAVQAPEADTILFLGLGLLAGAGGRGLTRRHPA